MRYRVGQVTEGGIAYFGVIDTEWHEVIGVFDWLEDAEHEADWLNDCLPGSVMTPNGWQESDCASDLRLATYRETDAESQ